METSLKALAVSGISLSYVKFQGPVAPSPKQEPVYEFKLEAKDQKYVVQEIYYTDLGVVWRHRDSWNLTPLPNVLQVW